MLKIIVENNYHPEQVFNVDETSLFWKKMLFCTYLMKDETRDPGFEAQKDRAAMRLVSC